MLTINGYPIDAEITGEPTYESEMTTFPMERGANMNDHVRNMPIAFQCEGIISDTPLGSVRTLREQNGWDASMDGRAITEAGHTFLVNLWLRKAPVTVTCALGTFDNMVLTSYVPKRQGGSIRFSGRFMLAKFVDNERTTVRVKIPAGQNTIKKKLTADPFEGPAMWRTVDYRTWVANGRTGPRQLEHIGRNPDPSGRLPWIWVHSDGTTPLDADEVEDWELEQRDNENLEEPTPGYQPGKVPGTLEKVPFNPFNPNASASATDRGAAYFSPTQQQWVDGQDRPILGNSMGDWKDQWHRFAEDQVNKQNYQNGTLDDAGNVPAAETGGYDPDTNHDGQFGPGDEGWNQ